MLLRATRNFPRAVARGRVQRKRAHRRLAAADSPWCRGNVGCKPSLLVVSLSTPFTIHSIAWNYTLSGELGSTKQYKDPTSVKSAVITCNGCSHKWTAVPDQDGFVVFIGMADVRCPRCGATGIIDGEQLGAAGG